MHSRIADRRDFSASFCPGARSEDQFLLRLTSFGKINTTEYFLCTVTGSLRGGYASACVFLSLEIVQIVARNETALVNDQGEIELRIDGADAALLYRYFLRLTHRVLVLANELVSNQQKEWFHC